MAGKRPRRRKPIEAGNEEDKRPRNVDGDASWIGLLVMTLGAASLIGDGSTVVITAMGIGTFYLLMWVFKMIGRD